MNETTEVLTARREEWQHIADLIDENAETLASFASDKLAAVKLVALCVRIGVREDYADNVPAR